MTLILSGSNGLSDVDGSAATPAIRGTDANTGIFFPSADVVAISAGGVEVGRFTSSGLNGVGGIQGQVFNNTGTFTIPSGVGAVKVTVVGGGGSGVATVACVVVAGNSGSTSSVASGTQTISTISATGGSGASATATAVVSGGAGAGGDLNIDGGWAGRSGSGSYPGASFISQPNLGAGNYGAGGAGSTSQRYGAGGGAAVKFLTGLTPGNTLTVTIGNGGASSGAGSSAGGKGVVIFEW